MSKLFVYLVSEDSGNHFTPLDFQPFVTALPKIELIYLKSEDELIKRLSEIEYIDTWYFKADWYSLAPNLKTVFTPAAGKNWVQEDPQHRVTTIYGKFHGPMIAESMLGLMLHFNRKMPTMIKLQQASIWDRNAQEGTKLLSSQVALIIGYGNIGKSCGKMLSNLGMEVLGHQRKIHSGIDPDTGVQYIHEENLESGLSQADHVILLLPGNDSTYHYMSRDKLAKMKPRSYIYNFGRGTTLSEADLLWALNSGIIAGAGIDVTEIEPLPDNSEIWGNEKIMLLPHSSCVFDEYQRLHVEELTDLMKPVIN